jgi:RNA polymerase sigma factor (sigma-70 family)
MERRDLLCAPSFRPRGSGSFRAWIRAVVEHCVIDFVRAQDAAKRQLPGRALASLDFRPASSSFLKLADKLACTTTSAGRRACAAERAALVREALEKLSEEQRAVLNLRFFGELSVSETAKRMGMSEAAVKMAAYRAIKRLSDLVAEGASSVRR